MNTLLWTQPPRHSVPDNVRWLTDALRPYCNQVNVPVDLKYPLSKKPPRFVQIALQSGTRETRLCRRGFNLDPDWFDERIGFFREPAFRAHVVNLILDEWLQFVSDMRVLDLA